MRRVTCWPRYNPTMSHRSKGREKREAAANLQRLAQSIRREEQAAFNLMFGRFKAKASDPKFLATLQPYKGHGSLLRFLATTPKPARRCNSTPGLPG